jgi:hypothetical protein
MASNFPRADSVPASDPRVLLSQFVEGLRDFIGGLVGTGTDHKGEFLFEQNLLQPMSLAYNETMPAFGTLQGAVAVLSDDRINDHALSGDSLRFKLAVVNEWVDRFINQGGVGFLRRALDAIEGLLDSIIDAAGTGGAIKELKEAIRNSIKH